MKIKSFTFGLHWLILDNNGEFKNCFHRDNIFLEKHPTDTNVVLITDKAKKSHKDSIRIDAKEVTEIENRPVINPSRAVLLVYLLRLFNPNALEMSHNLDGFELTNQNAATFSPDLPPYINNGKQPHYFNSNDNAGVEWSLNDTLADDFTFRITNGGLEPLTLKGNYGNGNFIVKGNDNSSTQQLILAGQTVEITFNYNQQLYVLTAI